MKKYLVIGNPIKHSLSPQLHNHWIKENNIDAIYNKKQLSLDEIKSYLAKIGDKELYAYGVYQIESDGKSLFLKIEGDEETIMGLPIKQIKEYLNTI